MFFANLILGRKQRKEKIVAVDHINLQVRKGEILGLLGPNGSGKTTLFKMLAGLLYPTEGTAYIFGYDIVKNHIEVLRHVNFIPGMLTGGIWCSPGLSARKNLKAMAELFNIPIKRVDEVIQLAGLDEIADVRVGTFSSGMMARLGLAFGLLKESPIYLLDEPTVGISIETVKEIHNYLKEHLSRRFGATILYASHIAREIQMLCDRVAILHKGKLLTVGEPEELIRSIGKPEVIEMEGVDCPSNAEEDIGKIEGVELVSLRTEQETGGNFSLRLHAKSARDVLPEIVKLFSRKYNSHIKYINISEPTLEDVYLHLIQKEKCLEELKD
jgi:ABC-2 type transport system ATP-binding protein